MLYRHLWHHTYIHSLHDMKTENPFQKNMFEVWKESVSLFGAMRLPFDWLRAALLWQPESCLTFPMMMLARVRPKYREWIRIFCHCCDWFIALTFDIIDVLYIWDHLGCCCQTVKTICLWLCGMGQAGTKATDLPLQIYWWIQALCLCLYCILFYRSTNL